MRGSHKFVSTRDYNLTIWLVKAVIWLVKRCHLSRKITTPHQYGRLYTKKVLLLSINLWNFNLYLELKAVSLFIYNFMSLFCPFSLLGATPWGPDPGIGPAQHIAIDLALISFLFSNYMIVCMTFIVPGPSGSFLILELCNEVLLILTY